MTKLWVAALLGIAPMSAAHGQIGSPIGGAIGSAIGSSPVPVAPAGKSATTITTATGSVSGNAGQSATTGEANSGSAKDDAAKPSGGDQRKTGASGIGWANPGSQGGSTPTGSAGSSRSGMPVTTSGF